MKKEKMEKIIELGGLAFQFEKTYRITLYPDGKEYESQSTRESRFVKFLECVL